MKAFRPNRSYFWRKERRAQPDPVQFVFCGNTRAVLWKRKERLLRIGSSIHTRSFSPIGQLAGISEEQEEALATVGITAVGGKGMA
jgi:hypothetical protein